MTISLTLHFTDPAMKVTIPEIAWHNRDPVFSADFSLGEGSQWRMATAGADSDVKVCCCCCEKCETSP